MQLDWRVCSRARLARDTRFDGKFFIGVLTTKIYCRPICRSRTSKESNVRYFPSAAAAAEAGFRPCLRCHPEYSPGAPVWAGTQNTVTRALRMISETGLDEEGVEGLAERLGVGSRHLRRLFLRHLGASPTAVAHTRRVQFAKKLIDETALPMTQIALASGFGSVRRFNGAIRKVYHRTPSEIRSYTRKRPSEPEHQYSFHLSFRPPYDWKRLLRFLAMQATPGVEIIEQDIYRRSICVDESCGLFEVSLDADHNVLNVRVEIGEPRLLFLVIERVRAMFDLDADWMTVARTLGADPALKPFVSSYPGVRVPGCWDGFELATRAILGQKMSLSGMDIELASRFVNAFGKPYSPANGLTHLFPTPRVLADADLKIIGVTRERENSIRALSRAVCSGEISFNKVLNSDVFIRRLSEIPGIQPWATQWIAMRALREPDRFPSLDCVLAQTFGVPTSSDFEKRSLRWRPWRAYAAMYLWNFSDKITANFLASGSGKSPG